MEISKPQVQKELSKEELKNVAGQLQQQNKFLMEQIQKFRNDELYKRIDYLFKVIENPQIFLELDKDFVKTVAAEIVTILTITEEPTEETK